MTSQEPALPAVHSGTMEPTMKGVLGEAPGVELRAMAMMVNRSAR